MDGGCRSLRPRGRAGRGGPWLLRGNAGALPKIGRRHSHSAETGYTPPRADGRWCIKVAGSGRVQGPARLADCAGDRVPLEELAAPLRGNSASTSGSSTSGPPPARADSSTPAARSTAASCRRTRWWGPRRGSASSTSSTPSTWSAAGPSRSASSRMRGQPRRGRRHPPDRRPAAARGLGAGRRARRGGGARWLLVETTWQLDLPRAGVAVRADAGRDLLFVEADRPVRRTALTRGRSALNGYRWGRCFYCRAETPVAADVDHVFPWVLKQRGVALPGDVGGVWNLVLACRACNRGESGSHAQPMPAAMSALSPAGPNIAAIHPPR